MPFNVNVAPDETVEANIDLPISKKPQLRPVLTTSAAYWPGKKRFAISDAVTTEKARLQNIQSIEVGRVSRLPALILGFLMAGTGLLLALLQFHGKTNQLIVKEPLLMLLGGIFFSFAGGRRRRLVVRLRGKDKGLQWTSPAAFGGNVNRSVDEVLQSIVDWAVRHSLNVRDARPRADHSGNRRYGCKAYP